MRVQQILDGLAEVRGGFVATPDGLVLEELAPGEGSSSSAVAEWLGHLAAAGTAAGLGDLAQVAVKGTTAGTVTAVRLEAFAHVRLDPSHPSARVERVLAGFTPDVRSRAGSRPDAGAPPGFPAASAAAAAGPPEAADPWAGLRHALVRGEFAEAAALRRKLAAVPGDGRPGSETLPGEELERVTSRLLEGVGSVLAGDAVGGGRILVELAAATQPNLSVRWLALHWITRAALRSGSLAAARAHVAELLNISKQLDLESRAVSQWTAAEVLAGYRETARALAWLAESRGRFERLADAWGLGRTWLAEARVLAASSRKAEAVAAARKALATDPAWDEAPVFLACQSILGGELDAALEELGTVRSAAADEVRAVIDAVRAEQVSQPDAAEYLREREAPPSPPSMKALERIASAWPRFVLARDALAWMLLKLGKYEDASAVFRGLLDQQLTAHERASVMLGLSCIANAQQPASRSEARLRVVVSAGGASGTEPGSGAVEPAALPDLSSGPTSRGGAATASPTAVFSGQLSVFALPDLLEFLRGARRTGLLVCSSPAGIGALRFQDGAVTGGASPASESVGAYLVRTGRLSEGEVEAATGERPREAVTGEVLVGLGRVDAAAVKEALVSQITQTIRTLATWTEGEFAFNREGVEAKGEGAITVSVDPQAVLLDLFREQDEARRGAPAAAEP